MAEPRRSDYAVGAWEFPNAIAQQVKLTATLKGQDKNRLVLRDPDDKYPPLFRVSKGFCFSDTGTEFYIPHERTGADPFCKFCGGLIEAR